MESQPALNHVRYRTLSYLSHVLEKPMIVLSLIWLILLILEFTTSYGRKLEWLSYAIWAMFIFQFAVEFTLAPAKSSYLKKNSITVLSLFLPAFRLLRIARFLRFIRPVRTLRSLRLLKILTSFNREARALRRTLRQRQLSYILLLTVIVAFGGAAGINAFENTQALQEAGIALPQGSPAIQGYGDSLWWTGMIITTFGSEYWPKTLEGRILGWLLSLYAITIFGYITAALASYFIGQDERAGVNKK